MDIVIEAIVESEAVKKKLFVDLDKIVKSSAILASNTSSISITRLASATTRPTQVYFRIRILLVDSILDSVYNAGQYNRISFLSKHFTLSMDTWTLFCSVIFSSQ